MELACTDEGHNGVESEEKDKDYSQTNSTAAEPERKFIDGKWYCLNGADGFLVYEENNWISAKDDDIRQKWDATLPFTASGSNPIKCVVDGVVMEWNQISQQWLPKVDIDENFLAQYHSNYGINYDFNANEGTTSIERSEKTEKNAAVQKKHKLHDKKEEQGWVELEEDKNTAVYVSNLPLNFTEESFIGLMSKCGVIQRDARTNKLKIKLYRNEDGTLKGDGRCSYIKKESVVMALDILDGWNVEGKIISVERAKFQMKGEFDPSKKKKKLTAAQKKRFIESQERIFEWKPEKPRNYRPISDCTVVMKNMFTIEQMMSNAALVLDLEEEIRKVCERFGTVKKIVVHDNNPEGVICVTFQNVEYSDSAVRSLNGRVVDGRAISVALWDGKTKYAM
ncbi:unnamed protein product [Thelazia callipaeda]|uniref:17S U2 SnRNP complex component HTATSF1 n=1 Tax=Thelazia callipaeda TaxID=103827 RepID=A0A0N5CX44_THECL|nr:unnamed protein product [Thelazia callipaeda]